MSLARVLSIAVAVAQLACGASNAVEPPPIDELRAAPLVARVDGKDLILSPYGG
jgi:hypothetical protein